MENIFPMVVHICKKGYIFVYFSSHSHYLFRVVKDKPELFIAGCQVNSPSFNFTLNVGNEVRKYNRIREK
jgi:hypothetical protein